MTQVMVADRRCKAPIRIREGWSCEVECPKAMALFNEDREYPTANDAFRDTEAKIANCVEYLSGYLANWQRDAPHLCAWLVFPLSTFDLGYVYAVVEQRGGPTAHWALYTTATAFNVTTKAVGPLFWMDEPTAGASTPMDVTNEMLAEALLSIHRGVPRLGVLNSYAAVEQLANALYLKLKTAQLTASGMAAADAEAEAERIRRPSRTDASFLFNSGLKDASGRSLLDDDKTKYDALHTIQKLRHQIAHTGHRPSTQEALDAHHLCCECVEWLAGVGGLPAKPLYPKWQDVNLEGLSFPIGERGGTLSLVKVR